MLISWGELQGYHLSWRDNLVAVVELKLLDMGRSE